MVEGMNDAVAESMEVMSTGGLRTVPERVFDAVAKASSSAAGKELC